MTEGSRCDRPSAQADMIIKKNLKGVKKMKKKISIEGMSCGHCVNHTREALSELKGVTEVEVNLEGKYAIVEVSQEVSDDAIKAAIEEVGYEVVGIQES